MASSKGDDCARRVAKLSRPTDFALAVTPSCAPPAKLPSRQSPPCNVGGDQHMKAFLIAAVAVAISGAAYAKDLKGSVMTDF